MRCILGSSVVLVLAVWCAVPARGGDSVIVSGTCTKNGKPYKGVNVQAYELDHSKTRGQSTNSGTDGRYNLSVARGKNFDILYDPPDEDYLPTFQTFRPGIKPDLWRDGFDGSGGTRYDCPDHCTDVPFMTQEEFIKKYGEDAFKKHVKKLLEVLPKDHPRRKQLGGLVKP